MTNAVEIFISDSVLFFEIQSEPDPVLNWRIQLDPGNRCHAKFLTSAKIQNYYCLSVILLLWVKE